MTLRDIAHTRSGDKGDTCNIAVIAYEPTDFWRLQREVTVDRVRALFGTQVRGGIVRYELPHLGALNFVLSGALGGGVTRSLALDAHGKSLASALLTLTVA